MEQREVIVVPASSGAPLQADSGEGVSAPSNPVPNVPKPTVVRLQWKAVIIQVGRELTVLVLVVTCLGGGTSCGTDNEVTRSSGGAR